METKATFSLDGQRIEISISNEGNRFSAYGIMDGSSGQILEDLKEHYNKSSSYISELETIINVWEDNHLHKMASETFENVSDELRALDGKRFPEDSEGGKAEDFEYAGFSNSDDTIDSRDIIARIEYLQDFLCDLPEDALTVENYDPEIDSKGDRSEAVEELVILTKLESEVENYSSDWKYGETLIRDSHFEDYAQELVSDIGDLPENIPSYVVIDWEATAKNIQQDYTSVEFGDETYWIR